MKKLSLLAIILIAACTVAMAQPRAIGGRIAYGIGVSYQHGLGEKNMLQVDLESPSFYYGIQAVATYNWVFPFNSWSGPGSWNWYAGVGGGVGLNWATTCWIGGAGMIGVEYNFKFPLQLSLDFRPLIGPSIDKNGVGFSLNLLYPTAFGLSARYKFGGK